MKFIVKPFACLREKIASYYHDIMRKYVCPQILKGSSKNEKIFDVIL